MEVWFDRRKNKLWFSVVLNVIIFILTMIIFFPAFETNDDYGVLSLTGGSKGFYDYHPVYEHVFLGIVLQGLFRICHSVPWYSVLQYFLLFCSFSALTYVFLSRMKKNSYFWIVLIFLLIFSYEGYVRIQYTKSAGIISTAGLALLFYAFFQDKIVKPACLAGGLLALLGSMYRLNQFFCEFALFAGLGVYFLFYLKNFQPEVRFRRFLACGGSCLALLAVVLLAWKADRMTYSSDEWKYYLEYDRDRSQLLDYGFPDYDANEETYQALGIDETAYKLFKKWTHADSEKITVEVMDSLIELKTPKPIRFSLLKDFVKTVPAGFIKITGFWCFGIMIILWLIRGKHGAGEILTVLCETGMIILLYLFLYYRGRYLINRVDIGIWMAAAVVLMWILNTEKAVFPGKTGGAAFLLLLILTQRQWQGNWRVNRTEAAEKYRNEQEVLNTIRADSDHLYLTKAGTISFAKAYGVWDSIPFDIGGNMYPLGGWTAQTPTYLSVLERFDVKNPFRDMIGNEKIYLIDNKIEMTMDYLHKWYDRDAEAVLIKKIGGYSIYQIQ